MTDYTQNVNVEGLTEARQAAQAELDAMTVTPTPLQGVIIQTSGDTVAAPSLDLVEYGVLYVDTEGYTSLMPWHMVARVAFFDAMPAAKPEGRE